MATKTAKHEFNSELIRVKKEIKNLNAISGTTPTQSATDRLRILENLKAFLLNELKN